MDNVTVSPFSDQPAEPIDGSQGGYPYIVIRLMCAVYQRENLKIRIGAPKVHIGHRASFVQHPSPYAEDGSISPACRTYLLDRILEAVRRLRFRMCVIWKDGACTYVEPDGQFKDSKEVPSGGFALPRSIEFDKRVPLSDVM